MTFHLELIYEGRVVPYMRYAKASNHSGRVKPKELAAYQDAIAKCAIKEGLRQMKPPPRLKVDLVFLLTPQKSKKHVGAWGLSDERRDWDNLAKSTVDALGGAFNDRIISVGRVAKIWSQNGREGVFMILRPAEKKDVLEIISGAMKEGAWRRYTGMA